MSERELLEHILYELRVANWMTAGRKPSQRPTPPDKPDTTVRSFGGATYTINAVDDATRALDRVRRRESRRQGDVA